MASIAERPGHAAGSCVSVTVFDSASGLGGITHALLPTREGATAADDLHFVDQSLRHLLRWLDAQGGCRQGLEVKLFGGGDVLPPTDVPPLRGTVGRQNIEAALVAIEAEGLVLSRSSYGGRWGRKIAFNTQNGEVLMKRLGRMEGMDASCRDPENGSLPTNRALQP